MLSQFQLKTHPVGVNITKDKRYILALSDSTHWGKAYVVAGLDSLVTSQNIQDGTVLRVLDYETTDIAGRRWIMLANVEVLGHSSKIGNPARLDVAADPSPSPSHQPGVFSQQLQQPNELAGATPTQTPGATLTGSLSVPVQQSCGPSNAPAAGSKATMQTPSLQPSMQGSAGQLQGIPPRTPGAHALALGQQPAGQPTMHLHHSQPSAPLSSLSNLQHSQQSPSQPPFDSQPQLRMSPQQWHPEQQTASEQANLQHTSVTGQQDPLYSLQQPSAVAASQLLQTPAQGPGDHPSVSLRLGSQGMTPAPAWQGPCRSPTTTPKAAAPAQPALTPAAPYRETASGSGQAGSLLYSSPAPGLEGGMPAFPVAEGPPAEQMPTITVGEGHAEQPGRRAVRRMLDFQTPPQPAEASQPVAPPTQAVSRPPLLIAHLNPWMQKWTIKVRVISRSEVREWTKGSKQGRVCTAAFADAEGGEIRAAAFNEFADTLYASAEPGSVVNISNGLLKPPQGSGRQYEMGLTARTRITACPGEQMQPRIQYQFQPIEALAELELRLAVDVLGILESVADAYVVTTKFGKEQRKRSLVLKDDSMCSIEMTLWGEPADTIGAQLQQIVTGGRHPVLAVKSAGLSEWFGRQLASKEATRYAVDPDLRRAKHLRDWFDNVGHRYPHHFRQLSKGAPERQLDTERATIEEACALDLEEGASKTVCMTAGVTWADMDNLLYPACTHTADTGRRCNKKLITTAEHEWFCESCNKQSDPHWRYRLKFSLQDHTGDLSCMAFAEAGGQLMGGPAEKLKALQEEEDPRFHAHWAAMRSNLHTLRLRLTNNTWNGISKIQAVAQDAWEPDFVAESRAVLKNLRKLRSEGAGEGSTFHVKHECNP